MSRRSVALVLLAALVAACAPAGREEPAGPAPAMPPFKFGLAESADFYELEFLPDGFPGKRVDGELVPQPIYGTYVLKEYLQQYESDPTEELREAIGTVGRAAVARMSDFKGALVFWYDPDPAGPARLYERHYSGLTQGYYAVHLHRAGVVTGDDELVDAGRRAFRSLTIPAAEGGVLFEGELGPSLAEVPQEPSSLILNGWQSAIASVLDYADESGSEEARDLALRSTAELERLLPLYDVPELKNTRYSLTGFQYVRLVFGDRAASENVRLRDVAVEVPGEGRFAVPVRDASRWQNSVLPEDVDDDRPKGRTVRLNVVLSRASLPAPNALSVQLESETRQKVTVQVHKGSYDPLTSSPVGPTWETVAEQAVDPGASTLDVPLPWTSLDLVGYPTNFAKKIEGQQTNVYHVIHVRRLREIAERTGRTGLLSWADRWDGYICEWGTTPLYAGLHVRTLEGISPVEDVPGCDGGVPSVPADVDLEQDGA